MVVPSVKEGVTSQVLSAAVLAKLNLTLWSVPTSSKTARSTLKLSPVTASFFKFTCNNASVEACAVIEKAFESMRIGSKLPTSVPIWKEPVSSVGQPKTTLPLTSERNSWSVPPILTLLFKSCPLRVNSMLPDPSASVFDTKKPLPWIATSRARPVNSVVPCLSIKNCVSGATPMCSWMIRFCVRPISEIISLKRVLAVL